MHKTEILQIFIKNKPEQMFIRKYTQQYSKAWILKFLIFRNFMQELKF